MQSFSKIVPTFLTAISLLFSDKAVLDKVGKSVIWIDELEKVFAGSRSSGETNAGTTNSMFAHFLMDARNQVISFGYGDGK
ncbi:hypothetical protein KKB18_07200 [bacterium]|nr:hypothetical protein [bacterium]